MRSGREGGLQRLTLGPVLGLFCSTSYHLETTVCQSSQTRQNGPRGPAHTWAERGPGDRAHVQVRVPEGGPSTGNWEHSVTTQTTGRGRGRTPNCTTRGGTAAASVVPVGDPGAWQCSGCCGTSSAPRRAVGQAQWASARRGLKPSPCPRAAAAPTCTCLLSGPDLYSPCRGSPVQKPHGRCPIPLPSLHRPVPLGSVCRPRFLSLE